MAPIEKINGEASCLAERWARFEWALYAAPFEYRSAQLAAKKSEE